MSVVKMAASRYRRISTLGNCVTFVIFPAAAGSALRPTAPLLSSPTDAASSANVRGSMLRTNLDSRRSDVFGLRRWREQCTPGFYDPVPPGRDWQRAYRDAIRDLRRVQLVSARPQWPAH